jgi:small-conductance mechanosensitive channel
MAFVLGCPGAFAANPLAAIKTPAEAVAAATAPEIIAPGDIPLRADIDERMLEDVRLRTELPDPSERLAPRLEQLADGILGLSRTLKKQELEQLSAIRLQSLENHWRFYERQLADWRRELERATARYSEDAAALANRRAVWEATRASLERYGVSAALGKRVITILDQVRQDEQALSKPLDRQFQLRRRANTIESSIDQGLKSVDSAIAYYDSRLMTIDAPPVWQAWEDTRFTQQEVAGATLGLRLESQFLREWTAANPHRIRGYVGAMLLLLPLMLYLSRRSRAIVATDRSMLGAAKLLRRPISAWIVLALVCMPFAFPDAPIVLHQVALLLSLVPVLRLLPPQVFEVLGPLPYMGTALYVLHRLRFLLLGQPLYFRLYLLVLCLLTLTAIVALIVSRRRTTGAPDTVRIRKWLRALGWVAVAALLVAIAANVVGNISLAEVLTAAVLDSAYIGLALYAGTSVLTSVLNLLLARRSAARFRVLTQHAGPLLASVTRVIRVVAIATWVWFTLSKLRIARPVYLWVKDVLTYPLEAGQISITLGSVLLFLFAVWLAFLVARTVRYVLRDEVLPRMALPRGVGNSVATLTYYGLVIVGLLVALAAAGFQTSQFAIVFGALGVGIGFGLQNVVNNFVSGLILMFERPIQPGDTVEVSGTSGKVRAIGMRATTLTTFEGADVIVPNGTLLSEKLINWTLTDMTRRIDVDVGVAYGSDPRQVLALLVDVAAGTPGISKEPAPNVLFVRFGANSLDFGIRAWTTDFDRWVAIRTEMTARVYEALRSAGIEIPFPQHDLHLRSVSDEAGQWLSATARPPVTEDRPAPGS